MNDGDPESVVVPATPLLVEDVLGVVHREPAGVKAEVWHATVVRWVVWKNRENCLTNTDHSKHLVLKYMLSDLMKISPILLSGQASREESFCEIRSFIVVKNDNPEL